MLNPLELSCVYVLFGSIASARLSERPVTSQIAVFIFDILHTVKVDSQLKGLLLFSVSYRYRTRAGSQATEVSDPVQCHLAEWTVVTPCRISPIS